jgi:hypothetical protein
MASEPTRDKSVTAWVTPCDCEPGRHLAMQLEDFPAYVTHLATVYRYHPKGRPMGGSDDQ